MSHHYNNQPYEPSTLTSPEDALDHLADALLQGLMTRFKPPHSLRSDIVDSCKATVDYIDEENIEAVMFVDRSARPIWRGIKTYWERTHEPEDKVPNIFFINPTGFKTGAKLTQSRNAVQRKFAEEHPFLNKHKESPVLVMDTCVHRGRVIKPILKTLDKAGFMDVRFGVVDGSDNDSDIKPDLVALDRRPAESCYAFGMDRAVRKGSLLHTSADRSLDVQQDIASLRKVIKDIAQNDEPCKQLTATESSTGSGLLIVEGSDISDMKEALKSLGIE